MLREQIHAHKNTCYFLYQTFMALIALSGSGMPLRNYSLTHFFAAVSY